jgi:uncharacterized protein (TIGR03382 family)
MRASTVIAPLVCLLALGFTTPAAAGVIAPGGSSPFSPGLSPNPNLATAGIFQSYGSFAAASFNQAEENPGQMPAETPAPAPIDLLVPELSFDGAALWSFASTFGAYNQYMGEEMDQVRAVVEPQYAAYVARHRALLEAMNAFYVPAAALPPPPPSSENQNPAPGPMAPEETGMTFSFSAAFSPEAAPAELTPNPEPGAMALCALALPALLALRRRR